MAVAILFKDKALPAAPHRMSHHTRPPARSAASYPAHLQAKGYNAFYFNACANAWLRNVRAPRLLPRLASRP